MIDAALATQYINASPNRRQIMYEDGGIPEIIQTIIHADQKSAAFTRRLAPQLVAENDMDTLHNIWRFTRKHIQYRRDKPGYENIKSPGRTWADGVGDCKSFSVFIGSILQNLGFKYRYRVAFYDPAQPESGHIYPVVILGGREVIVDAVHTVFDEEVRYWKASDYSPQTGRKVATLAGLYGSNSKQLGWMAATAVALYFGINMLAK